MSFYPPIDTATFDELKAWWDSPILPEWADDWASFFDELAFALSHQGYMGREFLKESLYDPNTARRCAALDALADLKSHDSHVERALESAFAAPDVVLKTRAMWGLIHLRRFILKRTEVEQLFYGNHERLSALAMVYLSRAFPEEQLTILRAGLSSSNPRQREYACDEIGDNNLSGLMPDLKALWHDTDTDVAQAARANFYIDPPQSLS